MKCLLLAPLRYPFISSIISGLQTQGVELKPVDYQDFFPARTNRWYNNYTALPQRVRKVWEKPYVAKANARYLEIFRDVKPDLVFIYNNQLVDPGLLQEFKKTAKIAFMLGDNPLYTPTSLYNLHILFFADYVISPDSMWRDQLTQMGVPNVHFDCFGINNDVYFPKPATDAELAAYRSDFIYVGSASKTNWGTSGPLFLHLFKDFDLRAYISGDMSRWLEFFPEIGSKVIPHDRFDAGFNNLVYNCSKIAPVELVPSLFKGIHVRIFDILGAGILPLCEYSADLDTVFEGIDIPVIKNYPEAQEVARFWLNNDAKRRECVRQMRDRVLANYAPEMVIQRMLDRVFQ